MSLSSKFMRVDQILNGQRYENINIRGVAVHANADISWHSQRNSICLRFSVVDVGIDPAVIDIDDVRFVHIYVPDESLLPDVRVGTLIDLMNVTFSMEEEDGQVIRAMPLCGSTWKLHPK